jgi:hypothetical protein
MKQNEKLAQPFFAKFLESQKAMQNNTSENHAEAIAGVTIPFLEGDHTMKYPSDGDDDLPSK